MTERSGGMAIGSTSLLDVESIKEWCGHWTVSNDDPKCKHPSTRLRYDEYPYCDNRWCPLRTHTSNAEHERLAKGETE